MTKKEIELQCEIAYQEKFLELTGLKVGDKVECYFTVEDGTHKQSYLSSVKGVGTIIRDDNGYAVLSDNEYSHSKSVRNKPWSCCDFSTHWEYIFKQRRMELNSIVF